MDKFVAVGGACLFLLMIIVGCEEQRQKPTGKVYFSEPQDGATVKSPVKIVMGIEGLTVKPAGEIVAGTGHHHVLINLDGMAAGKVIPNDDMHKHFGKGQTETMLDLTPGDYKLTLQFADGLHQSYGLELASTINVKVVGP